MSIKRIRRPKKSFRKAYCVAEKAIKKIKDKKGNESDLKGKVYKLVSVLRILK